jgi:HSP20 family protein
MQAASLHLKEIRMAKKESKQDIEVTTRKGELAKARPTRALSPFEDMERLFEQFFGRSWLRPFGWESPLWGEMARSMEVRVPSVDVIDREEEVVVRAEIPGIDKEDLISLSDDRLTIKVAGERGREGNTRREMSGSFTRVVTRPRTSMGEGQAISKTGPEMTM